MKRRLLTVFGATGAQGGGLVRAVLRGASPEFDVRAVTRDPDGAASRALRDLGAQVVAADLDRPASLLPALAGADAAFCVTNFWEHQSPEREIEQATALAQAAAQAAVPHVVWSTLEDTRLLVPPGQRMPVLCGRFNVPHFDAKGEADAAFRKLGVPATFLLTSFYWDNLVSLGMGPRRGPDGRLKFTLPLGDSHMPGIAAQDIGPCALALLRAQPEDGRRVGIAGEHASGARMAAVLADVLGQPVDYEPMDLDAYRGLGFPGADDLGNMFQYKREHEASFRAARDVDATRRLHPGVRSFEQWARDRRAALLAA